MLPKYYSISRFTNGNSRKIALIDHQMMSKMGSLGEHGHHHFECFLCVNEFSEDNTKIDVKQLKDLQSPS